VVKNEQAVYHVMSRTALDGYPLGDLKKEFLVDVIRKKSRIYFVDILGIRNKPGSSTWTAFSVFAIVPGISRIPVSSGPKHMRLITQIPELPLSRQRRWVATVST
jgi:hypothetical protein